MPVFVKNGVAILYVHVPKTGGTAIETFFVQNGFELHYFGNEKTDLNGMIRRCSPQHMHAGLLRRLFYLRKFKYIFMTVRDPYTRAMSEYMMHRIAWRNETDFASWFTDVANRYAADEHVNDNHVRPQADFLLKSAEVFRQEDGFGPDWVARIEARIGSSFDHRQVGRHQQFVSAPHDVSTVDAALLGKLTAFYKIDFETFGYQTR